MFSNILFQTGVEYGNCLIVVENNSIGWAVLNKLEELVNANITNTTESETLNSIKYTTYSSDEVNNYQTDGPRLTNQEKSVIINIQKDK